MKEDKIQNQAPETQEPSASKSSWIGELIETVKVTEMSLLASSLAFSTALSIVPLIIVSLSVFRYLGGLEKLIQDIMPNLLQYLSAGNGSRIASEILAAVERVEVKTLGIVGFVSFLFSASFLIYGIESAIFKIWGVEAKRKIWIRFLRYLSAIVLVPLCFAIFWGLVQSGWIPILKTVSMEFFVWISISIWLVLIIKYVPNARVQWSSALIGGLFISFFLFAGQKIYAFMVENFLAYNKVYGSIAAVPVFLFWLLLGWYIFFFGNAVAANRNSNGR